MRFFNYIEIIDRSLAITIVKNRIVIFSFALSITDDDFDLKICIEYKQSNYNPG